VDVAGRQERGTMQPT